MSVAYGHSLAESLYEPLPEGLFEYKFDWDPTLVFFFLLAVFYIKGLRAFKSRKTIAKWQIACFIAGVSCNIFALIPPIDPLSDRLFFVHMIQHMMIVNVGVPLMLFGAPFFVVIRGMPAFFRRYIYFPILRNRLIQSIHRLAAFPLISLVLFEGNYWFWHVPRFYNWALLNDWIHLVEHACMSITAIYLWRHIIDPYPMRSRLHMGFRLLFLGAIMILDSVLAAALTYSETVWYAYEGIPMPSWWLKNWDHLDDQRLGGLIMWVPGGFLLFLSMTVCFFAWVYREQQKEVTSQ